MLVALVLGYVALHPPAGGETVQTPIQPTPQAALLDLRNFSVVRSPLPSSTPSPGTLQLDRNPLELAVQLPVGAEEGPYELQILGQDNQPPLAAARGAARIENQITTLRVQVNTSHLQPGEYRLALRRADFNWRYYPLTVR
jgi:hypothetical protein